MSKTLNLFNYKWKDQVFFDSVGQRVSSATSSVSNAVSGSIATGLLNVLLKADTSALNLYQASARAVARRNPEKVAKAEEFLVRFSAAIRKGLDEGLALSKPAPVGGRKRTKRNPPKGK